MSQQWTIDRKVNVPFLLGLLCQTFMAGWYISSLEARVNLLEAKISEAAPYGNRLTVMETKLENVTDLLREIRSDVRRGVAARSGEPDVRVHTPHRR